MSLDGRQIQLAKKGSFAFDKGWLDVAEVD